MNLTFWRKQLARVLILFFIYCSAEAAETPWRFSNPRPHGNNIIDMAIHGDFIWQVGDRGSVYTSPDLDDWFPRDSGTTQSLRGITFFGNSVFISGSEGTIVSGDTPWTLKPRSLNTSDWLEGIAASTNMLVAVGDNGAIYNSTDGLTWNRNNKFSTWLRSVAYGLGAFVCVGEEGFVAVSSDGLNWNQRNLGVTANLNHVNFTGNMFWIVGDAGTVITNNSRFSFFPFTLAVTNNLYCAAASTNEVVLAGDSIVLMRSNTNSTWLVQSDANSSSLAPEWPYYSALWDGRLFLLGGRNGMKVEGYRTNIVDPILWYSAVQPTRNWLWSVAQLDPIYAAVGDLGTILTSSDGFDWTREVVPTNAVSEILLGVGGSTNCMVAVGTGGTILYSQNLFTNLLVTNLSGELVTNSVPLFGVEWEQALSPTTNSLQGVSFSSHGYVVVGDNGTILTSANGINWVSRSSPTTQFLSSVIDSPLGLFAVGDLGTIVGSSDAARWSLRTSGVTNWIYSIRWANSTLMAVGEAGLILTSTDGSKWVRRNSGVNQWLNDSAYVAGRWFVAANSGWILTSTDGINWSVSSSGTSRSLNSLAFSGNQIIAAGADGVILRKNLVQPATPVNFLSFSQDFSLGSFLFDGFPDQQFWLEEATSINGPWKPITALELLDSSGTLLLQRDTPPSPQRFYRTRLRE